MNPTELLEAFSITQRKQEAPGRSEDFVLFKILFYSLLTSEQRYTHTTAFSCSHLS